MKFPVLFRILAVFNLLGGIILLFMVAVMLSSPMSLYSLGSYPLVFFGLIAIWMLVVAFSWFFASRASYGLLIVNFMACMGITLIFVWFVWLDPYLSNKGPNDSWVPAMLALLPGIYSLFSLLALFYAPVRQWRNQIASGSVLKAHPLLFSLVAGSLVVSGSLGWFLKAYRAHEIEIVTTQTYFVNDHGGSVLTGSFPSTIPYNGNIDIPLTDSVEIDGIKIPVEPDGKIRPWKTAKIQFYDSTGAQVMFKKTGEYYVARFAPVRTKGLTLYPSDPGNDTTDYYVASVTLVNHVSLFDKRINQTSSVAVMAAETYDEPDPGYSTNPTIYKNDMPDIMTGVVSKIVNAGRDYYFNIDAQGSITLAGSSIGNYQMGLESLKDFSAAALCWRAGGQNAFESCIDEALGHQLFFTSPEVTVAEAPEVKYRHVNPEAIRWASDNLMPDPDMDVMGYKAQDWYDNSFKHICRGLVMTHQYLEESVVKQEEIKKYQDAMDEQEFDGPRWLSNQYAQALQDAYPASYNQMPYVFIGFWLRRNMDESDEAIWSALIKFMRQFDSAWLQENLQQ